MGHGMLGGHIYAQSLNLTLITIYVFSVISNLLLSVISNLLLSVISNLLFSVSIFQDLLLPETT